MKNFLHQKDHQGSILRGGFTLMELLVVIAIVALLAAIVLASVSTARSKGTAAKAKGNMGQMRNAAELFYISNGNKYGSVFPTAGSCTTGDIFTNAATNMPSIIASTQTAVGSASNMDCGATATAWSVAAVLPDGSYFCVDSTGVARAGTSGGATPYNGLTSGTNPTHASVGAAVCN